MEHDIVSEVLLFVGILLGPLCLMGILLWFILSTFVSKARWAQRNSRLKMVPCGRCFYYTGCSELPCAVNPLDALTKAARNCKDFSPLGIIMPQFSNRAIASLPPTAADIAPPVPPTSHAFHVQQSCPHPTPKSDPLPQ